MRSLRSVILPAAAAAALCLAASSSFADFDGRTSGKVIPPYNTTQTASVPAASDMPAPRSFDPRFPYKGRTVQHGDSNAVDCQAPANAGLDRCDGMK